MLMLLAEADPSAAHALCDVLQRRKADADLWVYYKMAPIIPILRMIDARKAGCPLQMPSSRLQSTVAGQEVWVEAAELLRRLEGGAVSNVNYSETNELLHKLAADDFSLLARVPPFSTIMISQPTSAASIGPENSAMPFGSGCISKMSARGRSCPVVKAIQRKCAVTIDPAPG